MRFAITDRYVVCCRFGLHDAIAAVNTAVVRHQYGLKWR